MVYPRISNWIENLACKGLWTQINVGRVFFLPLKAGIGIKRDRETGTICWWNICGFTTFFFILRAYLVVGQNCQSCNFFYQSEGNLEANVSYYFHGTILFCLLYTLSGEIEFPLWPSVFVTCELCNLSD